MCAGRKLNYQRYFQAGMMRTIGWWCIKQLATLCCHQSALTTCHSWRSAGAQSSQCSALVESLRPHRTLLSQSICCWPWELYQRFSRVQPFRTTTSICSEEWCTGVVLAVTSLFSQKKKDGWLQPLKLYATYPGVKQLSGKTRTMWNRSALVEVLCHAVQWTPLVYPILFKWKYSQIYWHTKQSFSKSQHLNTA